LFCFVLLLLLLFVSVSIGQNISTKRELRKLKSNFRNAETQVAELEQTNAMLRDNHNQLLDSYKQLVEASKPEQSTQQESDSKSKSGTRTSNGSAEPDGTDASTAQIAEYKTAIATLEAENQALQQSLAAVELNRDSEVETLRAKLAISETSAAHSAVRPSASLAEQMRAADSSDDDTSEVRSDAGFLQDIQARNPILEMNAADIDDYGALPKANGPSTSSSSRQQSSTNIGNNGDDTACCKKCVIM
jgi:cell division protein FtsB